MRKWIGAFVCISLFLAGCHSPHYDQTVANVADVKIRADDALHRSNSAIRQPPALIVNPGLYVDTSPISLVHNPHWFNNRVIIRGDQLPFSYYARMVSIGAGRNVLIKYQTGLDPSTVISMNYSGTVRGALDLLAAKTGNIFVIHGDTIYWQAFVTKTFDVAFMPGTSDYLLGQASTGATGASGGAAPATGTGAAVTSIINDSSASEFSSQTGSALSVWKDLQATIAQILSPDGKVMVSEATTTVTVRDHPSNVALVGQYIANLNRDLSKQVLVKIQILEVDLSSNWNFGINWALVAQALSRSNYQLIANYGVPLSVTTLTGAPVPQLGLQQISAQVNANAIRTPQYTALINALNQQAKTSIVTEPRVVCLNNQVSVIRITQQQGYAASVQVTSGVGATTTTNTVTSTITPGNLITGLTVYVLPKIIRDKVILNVNADISTAGTIQTFCSSGGSPAAPTSTTPGGCSAGSSSIQLPNLSAKHFNQRSIIRSGDTLILAGFKQMQNQANAMQFFESQPLGGRGSGQSQIETVILITPIILHGSA